MQAIIMAAGKGSRLGELTEGHPKSFVKLHDKRLIEYNLEILNKLGVDEIIIVTGFMRNDFVELTKDMDNVKIVFNPFYEMVNVLGSFYMGMEYLHDDFLYLHADTLCEPLVFEELAEFKADINLPVDFSDCDEEAMKVELNNGQVINITKQMPLERAAGEFIGIASCKKCVIEDLKIVTAQLLEEKQFMEYFEAAIQRLIEGKKYDIQTIEIGDRFWAEIDFREDYDRAYDNIPEYMYR